MTQLRPALWHYAAFASVAIIIDRLTKSYALAHWHERYEVNSLLSFELIMNRGISWSMLSSHDATFFTVVSCIVAAITIALAWYAWQRYEHGYTVVGEVLVLAGAISNLLDRYVYGGVIDFIVLSYHTWTWPVFNVADMCIVGGVGIMLLMSLCEK